MLPFTFKCHASEVVLIHGSELNYAAVEKEAIAIVETVRKWQHFLARRQFTLKTNQRLVAFMFDSRKRTKKKTNKIQAWRLELGYISYDVEYRPGKDNVASVSFTRAFLDTMPSNDREEIHVGLCHSGVTRMLHFLKSKNRLYSTEEVKEMCSECGSCAELKPYCSFIVCSNLKPSSKPNNLWSDLVSILRVHYLPLHVIHIYLLWWMSILVSHLHFHVRMGNF